MRAVHDPAAGSVAVTMDASTAADLAVSLDGYPDAVVQALADALRSAAAPVPTPVPASAGPLVVATDGGCHPNPGPAGWAWAAEDGSYAAGSFASATNNVAELTALKMVLLDHPCRDLRIVYDSQYAVRCATEWGPAWRRAGKTGKANQALVYEIIDLLAARRAAGMATEFEWVRGHTGHPLNEAADKLCTRMTALASDGHKETGEVDL